MRSNSAPHRDGWDRQIESDAKAGKLDHLVDEALADYKTGKARKI
jgi:hypothetical protein